MRNKLKEIGNQVRHIFKADVVRFGVKSGWVGEVKTILLKDVRLCGDEENVVADHLWLTVGKQIERLGLNPEDKIQFSARVKRYVKGYNGWRDDVWDHPIETDYCLSFPTKIQKIV